MAESRWVANEDREADERGLDLRTFAEEHDLAIGEAREILQEAGCDRDAAVRLANRMKKW